MQLAGVGKGSLGNRQRCTEVIAMLVPGRARAAAGAGVQTSALPKRPEALRVTGFCILWNCSRGNAFGS